MSRARVVSAVLVGALVAGALALAGVETGFALAWAAAAGAVVIASAAARETDPPDEMRPAVPSELPGRRLDVRRIAWSLDARRGLVRDAGARRLRALVLARAEAEGVSGGDLDALADVLGAEAAALVAGRTIAFRDVPVILDRLDALEPPAVRSTQGDP